MNALLELATADHGVLRQLNARFDVAAAPDELIAATRRAIRDATDFDERDINHNFDYDYEAYQEVKRNLSRLIELDQLRPAMELSLELMKEGSYQVEMSDEGMMREYIEECLSVVLRSLKQVDVPAKELAAWCSKMLANDRVGFIATEELCLASISFPYPATIRIPCFRPSGHIRNSRNLGGMRWLPMAKCASCAANSIQEHPWPRRPGGQAWTHKTARHYRDDRTLPSASPKRHSPRTYRTRTDPFAEVWPAVESELEAEPRLLAKTLFDWLRREHPGQFLDSHRRTFERRVRQWRALTGRARPSCSARSTRPAISRRRTSRT